MLLPQAVLVQRNLDVRFGAGILGNGLDPESDLEGLPGDMRYVPRLAFKMHRPPTIRMPLLAAADYSFVRRRMITVLRRTMLHASLVRCNHWMKHRRCRNRAGGRCR